MTQRTSTMEWNLTYSGGSLPIIDGNITVSESAVPGVVGTVVTMYDPDVFAALEPRTLRPPRVKIAGQRSFWTSAPVSEVSARFSGTSDVATSALNLTGVASGRASTPDAAVHDITGDIEIRAHVALADWTPSSTQTIVSKSVATGNQRSWQLNVNSTGNLVFLWSANGTATMTAVSTANLAHLADGASIWVRVTFDVNNGASGRTATFYTSSDGEAWTILGTPVTSATATSIYSGTATVTVGSVDAGANTRLVGKVFSVAVYNGIGGTLVTNPEFGAQAAGATSFVDSSGLTWTVTSPASIVATTVSQPRTLQYISDLLSTGEVTDFSERFGSQMSEYGAAEVHPIEFNLHVRRVRHTWEDGTMTIDLASDEALLLDWAVANNQDNDAITENFGPTSGATLYQYVNSVMGVAIGRVPESSSYGNQTVLLDSVDTEWRFGVSGWDLFQDALNDRSCKLRPLPNGNLVIEHMLNSIGKTRDGVSFTYAPEDDDVVSLTIENSRTDDWYDSAVLSAENSGGTGFVRGANPSGAHSRTYTETRPKGSKPNNTAAKAIVTRSKQRGIVANLVMPILAPLWIRNAVYLNGLTGMSSYEEPWYTRNVTYDIYNDRMTVDMVYDIPYE
jgi:hypothetical protein